MSALFLILINTLNATIIKGIVIDNKGETLPFASVYIKGTTKGTTTNIEGKYSFDVEVGEHTFICQYIGFQKTEVVINVQNETIIHNFKLSSNAKSLKEVTVKNGENLAIPIMKKTIAKRSFYNKEIDAFKASVYIKGNFKLDEVAGLGMLQNMMGGGKKGGNEMKKEIEDMKGIIHLSESFSDIFLKRPDKYKVIVRSTKVSGNKGAYGFSDPIFVNFYDNNVNIGENLNPRGFISPIAETALLSYKYELLSAYMEDGKVVNRIKVTPRRKYEPLFSGVIEIIENEWRLHTVDLKVEKENQLEVMDMVQVKQIFVPVGNVLMVKDQSFKLKLKLMGFGVSGNFVNVYSDYSFDVDAKNTFDKFMKEYDKDALTKPKNYFDEKRPVPLDKDEVADYIKKDSIEIVESTKKDTAEKHLNSVKKIIFRGLNLPISKEKKIFTTPLIGLQNFNWNTVEGLNYTYGIKYENKINKDKTFSTSLKGRYGFSNQQLNAKLNVNYKFGKTNKSILNLVGGRYVFQYNNEEPVNELLNSCYTLFYNQNFYKFYQAYFGRIQYQKMFVNGIGLDANITYQDRLPLANTNNFSFSKNGKIFTENYPVEKATAFEPRHQAIIFKAGMSYQPGRKYIKYTDRIEAIESKYPTFNLEYWYGMPVANSDVDYSKYKLSMNDDMNLNLWGTFKYNVSVGGFIHKNKLSLIDYTHFNGNQILLASPYLNSFQLSPYYANSNTESFYTTVNAEHHFNGLLTNKIPLFRRLNWYLVASTNSYYVNKNNNYVEASLGLENIGYKLFRFIRVDGIAGYSNFKTPVYGVRIGFNAGAISIGGSSNKFD